MRLHRQIPSSLPRIVRRCYSTPSQAPVVNVHDVPAPGSGRIRILNLNRPSARNAISRQLLLELSNNIKSVASQYDSHGNEIDLAKTIEGKNDLGPVRALILASEVDSCFCAGADLKERADFTPEETDGFLANLRNTFQALSALPIPTIAAVSSLALGGGLELALCTHLRVFASTAQVGLPETRLGIIPGAGGTFRLPALVGMSRARDLILTGRRVSAPEAYFLGIADRLVEITSQEGQDEKEVLAKAKEEVLRAAVVLAGEICEGAPVAIRSALQAVHWARGEVETKMYDRVVATEDRNEALNAFKEKRRPVFTGK